MRHVNEEDQVVLDLESEGRAGSVLLARAGDGRCAGTDLAERDLAGSDLAPRPLVAGCGGMAV